MSFTLNLMTKTRKELDNAIGEDLVKHKFDPIILIKDTNQLFITDHTMNGYGGYLVTGRPNTTTMLTEGEYLQAARLMVGTTEGDQVFDGVAVSIVPMPFSDGLHLFPFPVVDPEWLSKFEPIDPDNFIIPESE